MIQQVTLPIFLTVVFKSKDLWNVQSISENSTEFQHLLQYALLMKLV